MRKAHRGRGTFWVGKGFASRDKDLGISTRRKGRSPPDPPPPTQMTITADQQTISYYTCEEITWFVLNDVSCGYPLVMMVRVKIYIYIRMSHVYVYKYTNLRVTGFWDRLGFQLFQEITGVGHGQVRASLLALGGYLV